MIFYFARPILCCTYVHPVEFFCIFIQYHNGTGTSSGTYYCTLHYRYSTVVKNKKRFIFSRSAYILLYLRKSSGIKVGTIILLYQVRYDLF